MRSSSYSHLRVTTFSIQRIRTKSNPLSPAPLDTSAHLKQDLFKYTALVRSPEKLKELGVKTVIGSFTDEDVLTEQASKADVVLCYYDPV
ncbi:hypothetical protein JOM56_001165 [Amanita muscaria]